MSRCTTAVLTLLALACVAASLVLGSTSYSSATFVASSRNTSVVRAASDWTPPTVALASPGPSVKSIATLTATASVPSYAVPEADAIATSLRQTAGQLDQLVRREREFAANASHQLRTPITALRLQLEDLTLWPDTPPAMRDELELGLSELDRLSSSIDDLLGLARGQRMGQQIDVDLAALVAETAGRWRTILGDTARGPVLVDPGVTPARLAPGPVTQVLDVLIDNALMHGSGTVTVATRDVGTHLEVRVSDEGDVDLGNDVFQRGVTTQADAHGHGVGLAVASELAELVGGHLSIDHTAPTSTFVLWLPRLTTAGAGRPGQGTR